MIRRLLAVLATATALAAIAPQAQAAVYMCAPETPSGATGPRQIVNPNTGTLYSTNPIACAMINSPDVGYFLAQGYTVAGSQGQISLTNLGSGTGATSTATAMTLPPNAIITDIAVENFSSSAPTAGITVNTSAGYVSGTAQNGNVLGAMSAPALTINFALPLGSTAASGTNQILTRAFTPGASQQLFVDQVTHASLGAASLTVTIFYNIM